MTEPMLEEIRDLASQIQCLGVDLDDAIATAVELGYTTEQIAAAQRDGGR